MSMSQPCARKKARSPMVDLLPGRMTISASAGIGSPGLTKTSLTPGSMPSGSRSSKLAMRARTGTAMTRVDDEPCARSRSTASSAGSHAACGNHGTTPSEGQPVKRVIAARPCSNNPTSPRNLLTMKPWIRASLVRLQNEMRAGQTGDDAAAIDVPEHHHGHVGGRGKSHVGDVAGAQVDLRRAAGAFDQDDIRLAGEVAQNSPAPPAATPPSFPDSSWRAACPSVCPAR